MPPRQRPKERSAGVVGLLLGGAALVVLVLVFALGMLVGQHWPRPAEPPSAARDAARKPAVARRSGLVDPVAEPRLQEKLTFYQTLTAPLQAMPAADKLEAGKPEAPRARPAAATPQSSGAAPSMPSPPSPPSPASQEKAASSAARPASAQPADARGGAWVVQVGAFRDRAQAESVRRPLAAAGLDAYVSAIASADGRLTYRVRVGSFRSRDEAARVAARVRQERALPALITSR